MDEFTKNEMLKKATANSKLGKVIMDRDVLVKQLEIATDWFNYIRNSPDHKTAKLLANDALIEINNIGNALQVRRRKLAELAEKGSQ